MASVKIEPDIMGHAMEQTLRYKEERSQIASMSEDEYRGYLRERYGEGKWADREIELLVKAKRDREAFNHEFVLRNHIEPLEPINEDLTTLLRLK